MPALSAYLNVWNTCLVVLQQKGFRAWTDEAQEQFFAERDGWDFFADDPIQLLGLVALHDHHRPDRFDEYWWRIEEPWLVESLPTSAPPYISVTHQR
jgi:hypothetical protein